MEQNTTVDVVLHAGDFSYADCRQVNAPWSDSDEPHAPPGWRRDLPLVPRSISAEALVGRRDHGARQHASARLTRLDASIVSAPVNSRSLHLAPRDPRIPPADRNAGTRSCAC